MPEVLTAEDEDQLLAAERERARLEEEARILAFQQQQAEAQRNNFISQPDAELAALQQQFNNPPPMPRQMIGDAQYQLEVERARRGSGFIAPDVDPGGNVITPGYDPFIDPRAIAAEREAINFQRQQLYGQLLRDGSTAAEAYRFANSRYPDIKSAAGLIRAETALARRAPMQPEIQTIDGIRMMRTGPSTFARIPEQRTTITRPVVPLDVAASQKILSGQITETRNDLARARKAAESDPGDVDAARRARIYQEQLRELEQQFQTGSTNFMGAMQAPVRTFGPNANASPAPRPADPNAIRAAFRAGRLSRADAEMQLKAIGFE